MKINELKNEVFEKTGLDTIKQIKKFYPQFSELNFRLKATWQTVYDTVTAQSETEFHQEDIDAVIDAITIPASAIACELPEPTPQDGVELIAALASYQPASQSDDWAQVLSLIEPWGEERNELAAQRIRRQFRRRRWRADRKRGFAAAA